MNHAAFSRAAHFSVVWAVMLSFITLVEWHSLDRDPLKRDILSPFINRHVNIVAAPPATATGQAGEALASPGGAPQYQVELDFNGPLFLACFFIPITLFHGIGLIARRIQSP